MSGLNWEKINAFESKLKNNGAKGVFNAKDIKSGESEEIRLLTPHKSMGGLYVKEVKTFWINNKPYVSLETYGEACPLVDEREAAMLSKDKDIKKLLTDKKMFKVSYSYLMPIVRLKVKIGTTGEIENIAVIGEEVVILECGKMLAAAIHKIFCDPKRIRQGKGDSILSREFGINLTISKSGANLDTEYAAMPDTNIMDLTDASFDEYYKNTPDIIAHIEKERQSPEFLRSVIRNYLYGDEIIEGGEEDQEEAPTTTKKVTTGKVPTTGKVTAGNSKTTKKTSALLDDLDDE
jgi:hypothetical protein